MGFGGRWEAKNRIRINRTTPSSGRLVALRVAVVLVAGHAKNRHVEVLLRHLGVVLAHVGHEAAVHAQHHEHVHLGTAQKRAALGHGLVGGGADALAKARVQSSGNWFGSWCWLLIEFGSLHPNGGGSPNGKK